MRNFAVRFQLLFTVIFCAALCACASVSVKDSKRLSHEPPVKKPDRIFVTPFEFSDAGMRVDRSGQDLEEFKFEFREKMTRNLVKRLSKHVAPAKAIAATAPVPQGNYWLVKGRFKRVIQGSRALRGFVGLGAGGTKLDAIVTIYDLSVVPPRPFLRIETTGGSNISPGVLGTASFFLTGVTALFSLGNAVEAVRTGLTFDTIRTSREITAATSEYLYQQKQISYEDALGPKRLGEIPNGWVPFRKQVPATGTITVVPVEQPEE